MKSVERAFRPSFLDMGDESGTTALAIAARNDSVKLVRWLLEKGANPDLANDDGATPLYAAAFFGHGDCVRELARFATPGLITRPGSSEASGSTPLLRAAFDAQLKVVEALLETENPKEDFSDTPLKTEVSALWMAFRGFSKPYLSSPTNSLRCVDLLLPLSDLEARSPDGQLLSEWAMAHGHVALADRFAGFARDANLAREIVSRWPRNRAPRAHALFEQAILADEVRDASLSLQRSSPDSGSTPDSANSPARKARSL